MVSMWMYLPTTKAFNMCSLKKIESLTKKMVGTLEGLRHEYPTIVVEFWERERQQRSQRDVSLVIVGCWVSLMRVKHRIRYLTKLLPRTNQYQPIRQYTLNLC